MPDTSKAQFRFMRAVEHNPAFAKKVGVPQKVGKDFSNADKKSGTKYKSLPARLGKVAAPKKKSKSAHKPRLGFTIDGDGQG